MKSNLRFKQYIIIGFSLCSLLFMGCIKQSLDIKTVNQGLPENKGELRHFKKSAYSVYMLCDLWSVSPANVGEMIRKVNPDNKPVINLKITSEADLFSAVVNILNGGIIDRGVIVSLNKVTVEGDIIEN